MLDFTPRVGQSFGALGFGLFAHDNPDADAGI
jgi:hypothetical protein